MIVSKIDIRDDNYNEILNYIIQGFNQRSILPFLGAGISFDKPSSLPLANTLVSPLVELMWSTKDVALTSTSISKPDKKLAKDILFSARLERLLDALHKTFGNQALKYLDALWSQQWNSNHASLASLSQKGLLPWCVTLNFDLLIEAAANSINCSVNVLCPLTNNEIKFGNPPFKTCIIKPHGSFAGNDKSNERYSYLSATLSQVGGAPDKRNIEMINKAIKECPVLLVAGYSDNDWDIFPILINSSMNFKRIIWIKHCRNIELSLNELTSGIDERIYNWLKTQGDKSILLFGHFNKLNDDIGRLMKLNCFPSEPFGQISGLT